MNKLEILHLLVSKVATFNTSIKEINLIQFDHLSLIMKESCRYNYKIL